MPEPDFIDRIRKQSKQYAIIFSNRTISPTSGKGFSEILLDVPCPPLQAVALIFGPAKQAVDILIFQDFMFQQGFGQEIELVSIG